MPRCNCPEGWPEAYPERIYPSPKIYQNAVGISQELPIAIRSLRYVNSSSILTQYLGRYLWRSAGDEYKRGFGKCSSGFSVYDDVYGKRQTKIAVELSKQLFYVYHEVFGEILNRSSIYLMH